MEILVPILLLVAVLFISGLYIKENFFDTVQCGSFTNCKACSGSGKCAWCLNTQACVSTDRYGFPSGRECNGNDVVNFPNNCDNLPTNQGRPQTISVRSGSNAHQTITDASGQPAWLMSALRGGYVSGQQSEGAAEYKRFMSGKYNADEASDYQKWLTGNRLPDPNQVGGLGIRIGTTYNTGDMSQDYYKQFGNNSENLSLASRSESDITFDVADRYNSPQLDKNDTSKSTDNVALEALIKKLLAELLARNGVNRTQPFQDIDSTKKLAKEIAETIE